MDIQSDLVRDSQLDTQLREGYVVHTHRESRNGSGRRAVQREEYWRPVSEIGAGGYGSVWLQKCEQGQRDIETRAVKQISLKPLRNGKQIDVGRELEAIAKFSHEKYTHCFVKSYGWYRDELDLYITMEYLQHGDLARYLSGSPPLQEDAAGDIIYQILEGLSYMHNHEFVHRDLKPQPWWVKIGDFGVSKRRVEDVAQSTLLQGTLGYIAPELYRLIPMGTPYAADMWSLGEVGFQLMTKRPAFEYMSLLIAYAVQNHPFPVEELATVNISRSAQSFISSLMAPAPADRLTADAALKHPWVTPYLPSILQSSPPPLTSTMPKVESLTEEFASWNSISTSNPAQYDPDKTLQPDKVEQDQVSPAVKSSQAPGETPAAGTYYNGKLENYIGKLEGHTQPVYCVAFSPDGIVIASVSLDKTVMIWDAATGKKLRELKGHRDWVNSVAFSPDGTIVASGSSDKTVRIWDAATGMQKRELKGHSQPVFGVAFSPDGTKLASGSLDKTVLMWDVASGSYFGRLEGHTQQVNSVAFSPDGIRLASGSADWTVRIWDITTGRQLRELKGYRQSVNCVTFSRDGTILVSGSSDKTVRIWDVRADKSLRKLEGHSDWVNGVAISSDGTTIASGSTDNTVRIWDVATGKPLQRLIGHTSGVRGVAFSPSNTTIASGSYDGTVRTWSIVAGR